MLKRFAPLVPLALALLLGACATQPPQLTMQQPQDRIVQPVVEEPSEAELAELLDDEPYKLPSLSADILDRGLELVGTPYRFGGRTVKSGFDCSGFVGYLFEEQAGIQLPRSTRELIKLEAPKVARNRLQPGDILFFNDRGRGRVSHAGIYLGDDQFIHSSSRRSGGVRVDSLDDRYWSASYMEAKRVLAKAPVAN
jgi:cell wall-associated NlpC family hydrolase